MEAGITMKKIIAMTISGGMLLSEIFLNAHAGENEIRKSLKSNFPNIEKIEHVIKTPYAGLYEVLLDGQLVYTDATGEFVFDGNVVESKTRRNLTDDRKKVLFAIKFEDLPLELAVKQVKGNGKRKLAIFTDPNCGFCKKLENELAQVTDVTLYRFMYPIFAGSDDIVRNVICSKDQNKAWEDLMVRQIRPSESKCETQTDKVKALGQKMHVNGTPNLIFGNGIQNPGYLPVEELERNLNQAKM